MAAAVITPVAVTAPISTLTDLYTGPGSAAEEHVVDVRVCNKTTSAATYRLLLTNGTNSAYRWYDFTIQPGDTRDLEVGIPVPNGWKLQHQASAANTLDVTVTGIKRPTA